MNPSIPSTGDPIAAPVTSTTAPAPVISPAQTPVTINTTTTTANPPIAPLPATSAATTTLRDAAVDEARVRHFQSLADQAKAEADRRAAELEAAKRELDTIRVNSATIIESARQTAQQALQQVQELNRQREADQAKALKAQVLLEEGYRDLAPYAGFVQATNDESQLRAQLDALRAARQADLARVTAATTPVTPPAPVPPTTPPSFAQSPMQPTRVAPGTPSQGSDSSTVAEIQRILSLAQEQLLHGKITPLEYDQQMQQAIALGNADAARQMGRA